MHFWKLVCFLLLNPNLILIFIIKVCHDIDQLSYPVPGELLSLPILGDVIEVIKVILEKEKIIIFFIYLDMSSIKN